MAKKKPKQKYFLQKLFKASQRKQKAPKKTLYGKTKTL